jgi:hypothetical protein
MEVDDARPKVLIGDKGYDSDAIREDAWFHGSDPVIPTKSNRKIQRPVDQTLYAMRNRIVLQQTQECKAHRHALR